MARIPYFDLEKAPESYTRLIASRPPLNLYRMLPHAGKVAEGFLALGGAILRENTLDSKLREIAILRTGILCGASYEVHQHRRVARHVGLADDKIAALEKGADRSALDETETMVLEFTDQVVLHVKAPDAMFGALCARLSQGEVAELVVVIGFYMLVSRFLENFEVDIERPGSIE
jgi:alkylhydroperoxidase family enzyme